MKHLKEQQEKFSGLPLQSFDQSPRVVRRAESVHESKEKDPSIVEVMVANQAEPTLTPRNPIKRESREGQTPFDKNKDTYGRL